MCVTVPPVSCYSSATSALALTSHNGCGVVADRALYSTAAGIYALSICVLFTIKLDPNKGASKRAVNDADGAATSGLGAVGTRGYTRRLADERLADYRRQEILQQQASPQGNSEGQHARYGAL